SKRWVKEVFMHGIRRALIRSSATLFCLQAALSLLSSQPALALEEIIASYAGPTVTFLPAEVARQRAFLREQTPDIRYRLTCSQQISAKIILKQHGLDPDRDVIYRVVDTGTRIAAMLSGAIDSSMMDYGEAFRAKKAGLKMLVNAADYHALLAGGVGVNIKKLREQPDQVRRFLKAMAQALRYMQENPEGMQQVMMSWLQIDREMAADIYRMSIK